VVLNILTEHYMMLLKNGSTGNGAYTRKQTPSRVMVASRHTVFYQTITDIIRHGGNTAN
jgi:hypothetical protein